MRGVRGHGPEPRHRPRAHTEAYRLQASRESGVIAALGHRPTPACRRRYARPTCRAVSPATSGASGDPASVIDGTPLDANVWQQMNAEQQELVVEQLGSLLAAMHTMNSSLRRPAT